MPEDSPDSSPEPPEDVTEMMTPPTSGGPILPPSAAPLRETIGDFEVEAKLGAGGMGAVYRARQISLGRMVALKVLPAHMIEDAESVSRFQREARVAASLSHANLVRVFSAGAADGVHYIAMELIEGEDLGRRLKREGRLPAPEALRICAEVARGLDHAWRTAHLIHRDIKPANIFLAAGGAVKVGDLGLAKSVLGNTTGLTQSGTMMGTPHYISPEQARADKELDFRADIYSLGCTLYQMLTGQVPYAGTDAITVIRQHLDAPLPAILKVWPQCPVPLARLVGKMLKKSRHERPANYGELIAQIESVWAPLDPLSFNPEAFAPPAKPDPDATLLDTPPTPRPTATLPPNAPPPKSKAPLYAGLAAGVVILGVVAFLVWPKEEKLTKAELYAKQREAELAAATPAPEPVKAVVAPTPEPTAIKLWNTPDSLPKQTGVSWEDNALKIAKGDVFYLEPSSRDMILRAKVKADAASVGSLLCLRAADGHRYRFQLNLPEGRLSLAVVRDSKAQPPLITWPLPRRYLPAEYVPLEFKVIGNRLTVTTSGIPVGTLEDTAIPEPGGVMLSGNNVSFRDIEYVPLDGAKGGSSALANTTESWQDVLRDPVRFGLSPTGVEQTLDGLRFTSASSATMHPGKGPDPDGAIRARMIFGGVRIQVRARANSAGIYMLSCRDQSRIWLERWDADAQKSHKLREFVLPRPLQPGEEYELALRVVGETLTASFNGAVLGTASDSTFPTGRFAVATFDVSAGPSLVKTMEVLDLAGAMPPPTSPAEPWQDVLANPPRFSLSGAIQRTADGLLCTGAGSAVRHSNQPPRQDGAVRLKATWGGVRPALRVRLSMKPDAEGMYQLAIWKGGTKAVITRYENATLQSTSLNEFSLPRPLKEGELYELELRVVGQTFTAKFNGETLGSATDDSYSNGSFGMGVSDKEGAPTLVQSLEVLDLDAPGSASATPPTRTAEPWQDVLRDPAELGLSGAIERTAEGLRMAGAGSANVGRRDGLVRFFQGQPSDVLKTDGAIRMRTIYGGIRPLLRARMDPKGGVYQLGVYNNVVLLGRFDNVTKQNTELIKFPLPETNQPGQEYELELRVVGSTLTAKFNGKILGTVTDDTYREGLFGVGIGTVEAGAPAALIKSLEVLDLDAPAPRAVPAEVVSTTPPPNAQRFRGSSYVVVTKQVPWSEAKDRAEKMGGHLATITSAEEHQWVTENLLKGGIYNTWIGGSRDSDGQWKWITGEPFAFAEWEKRNGVATPDPKADKTRLQLLRTSTSPPTACWRNAAETSNWNPFFLVEWDGPPVSTAEPWQDALLDPNFSTMERTAEGVVLKPARFAQGPQRDGAVRLRVAYTEDLGRSLRILARKGPSFTDPFYQVHFAGDGKSVAVEWSDGRQQFKSIGKSGQQPLARALTLGEMCEFEFRVVGSTLTAKLNGQVVAQFEDTALSTGDFGVSANSVVVQSVEYLDLDTPAAANPASAAEAAAEDPANWRDIFLAWRQRGFSPGAGTIWRDSTLFVEGKSTELSLSSVMRNGAVRITYRAPQGVSVSAALRRTTVSSAYHRYMTNELPELRLAAIEFREGGNIRRLATGAIKPGPVDQSRTIELRAQGDTLQLFNDGVLTATVQDRALTEGVAGVYAQQGAVIERAEVLNFDELSASSTSSPPNPTLAKPEASFAAATKEAPFANGLGMKFVPVPITGGPTGGKRVLFSIWEVRVQDFEVFLNEKGRKLAPTGFLQGPTHPAVNVNWSDARAFCDWLTARERRAGQLGDALAYRLPSDHEWSCAVGLGDREKPSQSATEKSGRIPDVFPWGNAWPPPRGAVNLRGEEALVDQSPWKGEAGVPGYRDDFPWTAPVGSFTPNALGLFDFAGNAWEWCEDGHPQDPSKRFKRGGSLSRRDRSLFLSSARAADMQSNGSNDNGFRIVLAPVP